MVATVGRGAAGAEEPRQPGHPYSILLQQCDETRKEQCLYLFTNIYLYTNNWTHSMKNFQCDETRKNTMSVFVKELLQMTNCSPICKML